MFIAHSVLINKKPQLSLTNLCDVTLLDKGVEH